MSHVYKDPSAPLESRVADLMSRMTLEEKIHEMSVRMGSAEAPEIAARVNNEIQKEGAATRLGIPLIVTRESSHGLNTAAVTSFPACISEASAFDEDLMYRIGRAIAAEARAQGCHQGLSPMLDIVRDPRWGRMEETLGEDALLTSRLGVAFIKGLQGKLTDGIVATPKHFVGYGAGEGGKDNDPISITERDLRETYLPPFEAVVKEALTESIMICFGAVNGVPCTSDRALVYDLLKEWGFVGHVVDDCPGIQSLVGHRTAHNMKDATAQAINAGIDRQFFDYCGIVNTPLEGQAIFTRDLLALVREGKVSEARIDEACARVLRSKFKLGLFESAMVDPAKAAEVANNANHKALNREAAAKGCVLLKNDNNLLPLRNDLKTIAVIGPNAADGQLGDYSGVPSYIVSPLEGIKAAVSPNTKIIHAKGCEILSAAMVIQRFSIRLSGNLKVDVEDDYTLVLESNEGARLILDGQKIINDWNPGAVRKREAKIRLTKGAHGLAIEYFRGTKGLATDEIQAAANRNVLRLSWANSMSPLRIIPDDSFTIKGKRGVQAEGSGEGLTMELFMTATLEQPRTEQTRVVREVDFDWGEKSPILATAAESHEQETIDDAARAAEQADVAIVVVGETSSRRGAQQVSGEHFDRADIGLTGAQERLVLAVAAKGKPVVVVLVNGRSLGIPKVINAAGAVLEAWYPGQEGGHAIADILFGKVNPSGKLPVSIPYSAEQLPVYYNRRPRMGWYIDSKSEPMFPFGFGLSYTTFKYENLKITPKADEFVVTAEITNTGKVQGEEVVQLYVEDMICSFVTPVKKLTDFKRVSLNPGEMKKVEFPLKHKQLEALDAKLQPKLEPGDFKITVGWNSVSGITGILTI